ncbi:MAG: LysR family transcriptional regulator [Hyphomicrobiaceae bacterium]|nr:LysR family transcriptional regulator [Hyphomicrobiaceae bacterium]
MELHEIRYFLALSDTLNFTRAAERCNVSQPALTRAIKSLEDKLGGGPLVHRERGNTHLTELGRIMLPYFQHTLVELEAARSRAQQFVRMHGASLRVGLMCTIGPARLIDLFTSFSLSHPGTDIHLADGPTAQIEQQLERGDLDVAVYARADDFDDRFHALPLFEERFMVAVAPSHRLARQNSIRVRDLHQECYLGRTSCEFYEHLRRIRLEIGGIEFKRPYVSDRDDWIQCMVIAGMGFTYIPEYAATVPGLVTRPLSDPEVRRTVQLVTTRGRPHSPTVGAFLREARRFAWAGKVAMPPVPELLADTG